jgi:hypothetical protein
MTRKVFKYAIAVEDIQSDLISLPMPTAAEVLSVQNQNERLTFWALVDPDWPTSALRFRVVGTGHVVPVNPGVWLGTAQFFGGDLVLHVFQVGP